LLWPESRVALIYKADHASGIERVGSENLLILLVTRAAGRVITGPCGNLDRRTVGTSESGGAGRTNKTWRTSGTWRTSKTGRTSGTWRTSRAGRTSGAGRTSRTGGTSRTGRTGGPGSTSRPGRTSRTGRPRGTGRTRLALGWWLALPARSQEKGG